MPTDVIMPALGVAQETGKVLRWLKHEGEEVEKGAPIMEIETDKVTVEVEAPASGTLAALRVPEGADVPVGGVVAVILAAGEDTPAELPAAAEPVTAEPVAVQVERRAAPARRDGKRPLASPKARRLAQERGVDIASLRGSGPNGAVVAADVEAARGVAAEVGSVWRAMARHTTESWQQVPHFYLRREVDATRLVSWRAVARERAGCEDLSPTDLLVKVSAEALRRHPRVNGSWRDGAFVENERINVAIAVATDDGLVAPVIHDADRLDLAELVARRRDVVEAARATRLRPEHVADGTFTVSNLGMYGVDEFDAIVNAPQAAILAVGRIAQRFLPVDGQPALRPSLKLTLSFDHRAVDGARGAEFLETLASLLEEPAGLVS
jgi:pyruvate dehydrogenase E2 component (dihydrolipoamide acetyltransferase)